MDFPAYVPAAVRAHITTLLYGDEYLYGWVGNLASAEERLTEIEQAIEAQTKRGEVESLDNLRLQKAEAINHRDWLAGIVECLHRLAHDERMQEAYARLAREFTEDEQWRHFVTAADAARVDYSKYRERLKRAAELRDKIADTSGKLAGLLREIDDIGYQFWPSELFSIPELLRTTDNHEKDGFNLSMWQGLRHIVLGDLSRSEAQEVEKRRSESARDTECSISFVKPGDKIKIDPKQSERMRLHYAWDVAPSLSALLETVERAAKDFVPKESGMIGAAIDSRKANVKAEYLRAFGTQLTERHFTLNSTIMKAMEIVANVAINLPDIVSYDDVRKALARLSD